MQAVTGPSGTALGRRLLWLGRAWLSADGPWRARYAEPGEAREGDEQPPHSPAPPPRRDSAACRMSRQGEASEPARPLPWRKRRGPRCAQAAVFLLTLSGCVFLQAQRSARFWNRLPWPPGGWKEQVRPRPSPEGTLRPPQTAPERRYSEDYFLQLVGKLQNCTWKKRPQEYAKFKSELASCCDAVHNFITSQNNTPLGLNMTYEVDIKKNILITEEVLRMLPESQPLEYPFKHCAVVGNAGILKNSSCGAEIDKSDFVFRCNLPPILGNVSQDVGNKTNLVTINPTIIETKYNMLDEKKTAFLENIANYGDTFLLMPAFSFLVNTALSFKVHHTLREFHAKQKVFFFNSRYLKSLAQYWRSKGVKEFRLSSGLILTSAAVELCENVKLYGFWPFSKNIDGTPISHHYYDNQLPKPGIHDMSREYNQILQLHGRGVLKLQLGKCLTD